MIVIAPDSFKGTMSATTVCNTIAKEFFAVFPDEDIRCVPIADGGEGTVDALLFNGGERVNVRVKDPYFNDIDVCFGIMPDGTAVIETAAASGLPLVGDRKNPLLTTTYGTGQQISAALDRGCRRILVGLGGSATNDAGIGCLAALGVRFSDSEGNEAPLCGGGLSKIADIDLTGLDTRIREAEITALCDVVSPLYGESGAAYIFAPQKGADERMVAELDKGLSDFAAVAQKALHRDFSSVPGAGAAGGLGFGLMAFLGAKTVGGAEAVLGVTGFAELADKADLIITGEGCMDSQSILGKAPAKVAALSGGRPIIAIVGKSKIDSAASIGIRRIYDTNYLDRPLEQALAHSREDLAHTAGEIARDIKANGIPA